MPDVTLHVGQLIAIIIAAGLIGLVIGAGAAAYVEEQRRARTHIRQQLDAYGRGYRAATRDNLKEQP